MVVHFLETDMLDQPIEEAVELRPRGIIADDALCVLGSLYARIIDDWELSDMRDPAGIKRTPSRRVERFLSPAERRAALAELERGVATPFGTPGSIGGDGASVLAGDRGRPRERRHPASKRGSPEKGRDWDVSRYNNRQDHRPGGRVPVWRRLRRQSDRRLRQLQVQEDQALARRDELGGRSPEQVAKSEPHPASLKVGRSDPRLCSSGKRYKRCCGLARSLQ